MQKVVDKMKRWVVRGKFDKKVFKGTFYTGCEDGQYLYYYRTSFVDKDQATLFKTEGSAKGKLTTVLKLRKKWDYCSHLKDLEVVEIQIVIPGENNED